jgi:hypothetical protein
MLDNGFGEHNIQGIGDKHIPLIHNVMRTDVVVAISDRATDQLDVLFNTEPGRALLRTRGVTEGLVAALPSFGLSAICNVLAAIRSAKTLGLGPHDAIVTVATDGAELYHTERAKALAKHFAGRFDAARAAETFERHILAPGSEHVLVTSEQDRRRILNLGYYTWVEQQGVPVADFVARRDQSFWRGLRDLLPAWDERIAEFNARTGLA